MKRKGSCHLAGAANEQQDPNEGALTAQQCLEMMVAEAQEAILVLDEAATIRFANPAAGKLFPAHSESLVGQKFGYTALGCDVTELDVPIENNRVLTVEMRVSRTQWRGETAKLVVLHDVTERKLAETALRRARDELEKRVEERTAQLSETNRRLQQQIREREMAEKELRERNEELQQFAFIVSHDLQEPIRKVLTFSDMIVSNYAETLDKKGRDYIERMARSVKQMRDLIGSLFPYFRVVNNPAPVENINLKDVVQGVLGDLEEQLEQSGVSVVVKDLPVIEAHPNQMHRLFHELIQNAVKFRGHSNPMVKIYQDDIPQREVGADAAPIPEGMCRVIIEDNGIGFDEQYLDQIFKPFQCLNRRFQYEGTGMGLAICKKIVERHRGTITARSSPGEGAKFIISLPVKGLGCKDNS